MRRILAAAVVAVGVIFAIACSRSADTSVDGSKLVFPYPLSPIPTKAVFDQIREQAENGSAEHQLHIGHFYANGDLVEQDFRQAAEWYQKAAQNGEPKAQFYLGFFYDVGVGVTQDKNLAFFWYKKAVEKNDVAAHLGIAGFFLAFETDYLPLYFGNYDVWRAKALYLSGINSSNPSLEENFWKKYHKNSLYFLNSHEIFKTILEKSKKGSGDASLSLAKMVFHAIGVKRDRIIGNDFVKEAVRQKNPNACFMLGVSKSLNKLLDVPEPSAQLQYLEDAASSSVNLYFSAYYHYESIVRTRRSNNRNEEKILYHQKKLHDIAVMGKSYAQFYYGISLRRDSEDATERFHWLKKAANNGERYAKIWEGVQLLYGIGVNQSIGTAMKILHDVVSINDSMITSYFETTLFSMNMRYPYKTDSIIEKLKKYYGYSGVNNLCIALMLYVKDSTYAESIVYFIKAIHDGNFPATVRLNMALKVTEKINNMDLIYNLTHGISLSDFSEIALQNAARNGYGPAMLDLTEYVGLEENNTELPRILDEILRHPLWYEIEGYSRGGFPSVVSLWFWQSHADESEFALKNNDDFVFFYGENRRR
jgi:TPR repeat protein